MLIDRIKELNDTLYKAFAELHANDTLINNVEHKKGIANKIYELYELDYKLIRGEMIEFDKKADNYDIEKAARREELDRRKAILTPICRRRRFLFWKYRTNRAEELYEGEASLKAEGFLNTKEEALMKLQEVIMAADEAEPGEVFSISMNEDERKELYRRKKAEEKEQKREAKAERKAAKAAAKAEKQKRKKQGAPKEPAPQENAATPE